MVTPFFERRLFVHQVNQQRGPGLLPGRLRDIRRGRDNFPRDEYSGQGNTRDFRPLPFPKIGSYSS